LVTKKPTPDVLIESGTLDKVVSRRVRWAAAYRIIPSRYPPIDLFERVAPASDWAALAELEMLTNPRLRQEVGTISLIPAERCVTGPGASVVMAPFTHASPLRPGRFSDGTYGVYYAGREFETALHEVAFHMTRFYQATASPPSSETFRTYKGAVDSKLHDITKGQWPHLLDSNPESYAVPQAFAKSLRANNSNGLVYPSVRHKTGQCVAAFWPDVVAIPVQERHLDFKWDGTKIAAWFDHDAKVWARFS
jgi:hypothetical protein